MLHNCLKLVVGSVFIPHERSEKWYELQARYLKKTCSRYQHLIYVNGDMDWSIFKHSKVIGCSNCHAGNNGGEMQSRNHSQGLKLLLEEFRKMPADAYLMLDSDCFPVMAGWMDVLLKKMGDKFKLAAPIRYENLDVFPHPSAMFINGKYIHEDWLDFNLGEGRNLLGSTFNEVGCRIPLDICYPLLRSNFCNLHPMFAAVYNHMFYHHSCGSRKLMTRAIIQGYFEHYMREEQHIECINSLFHDLERDSDAFLNRLMLRTQ